MCEAATLMSCSLCAAVESPPNATATGKSTRPIAKKANRSVNSSRDNCITSVTLRTIVGCIFFTDSQKCFSSTRSRDPDLLDANRSRPPDEQDRSFLFRNAAFVLQADSKSFHMLHLLNRLKPNLCDAVFIYPNNARANRILVRGIHRPELIIPARLRRREVADANHAALTARFPRNSRLCVHWTRRGRRKSEKSRLHQRVSRACIRELALQTRAIKSEHPAKHDQPRRDGPRDPAKRSALQRYRRQLFGRNLAHDALL